jgi:hypothetical protein
LNSFACIVPSSGRFLLISEQLDFTAFQRFQGSTGRTSLDVQFQQIFAHLFYYLKALELLALKGQGLLERQKWRQMGIVKISI